MIQTQTPINPGNSGGPLLDDAMQIVGLNSFTEEGEGLNFAISADEIRIFLARPGDRLAKPTARAVSAKKEACEVSELGSTPAKDGKGVYYDIDGDCDGKADFTMFLANSKKEANAYLFDGNGDDQIDVVIYDSDHDGAFDYGLYDTDFDGEPDIRGEFHNGETEPYRMEKLS